MGSQVRADVTGPSISEMMKEVKGMLSKEITNDELKLAKQSISRSLPAYFETTQSTVATVGDLYLYDLPPDYYQDCRSASTPCSRPTSSQPPRPTFCLTR